MESVVDFIKNFKLSMLGLTPTDAMIISLCIVFAYVIGNALTRFLTPTAGETTKSILAIILNCFIYGVVGFIMLRALLNHDYWEAIVMTGIFALTHIRVWVRKFFEGYDRLVDKWANRP